MSASLGRVAALLLRQFYLLRSSVSRIVPLFVWVLIDILLWGFITRYLNSVSSSGVNFVPVLLGAALLWDFNTRVMHGVSMAFLEDVWARNFVNLFATPLRIGEYLAGLVITSIGTSAVGLTMMLLVATGAFGLSFAALGAMLVPFLLVLLMFGIALGIVGSALVLRLGPAAEWFVWPLPAIISPFAGVFYPIATLPAWMRPIAHAMPPSYVFEGMRRILTGGAFAPVTLAWGAALAALYIALACWLFARVHAHVVRTGLLARYTSESVS